MKRFLSIVLLFLMMIILSPISDAQEKKTGAPKITRLESDELTIESKALDDQILGINRKLQNVINKYKLMTIKDIRIVPYRVTYKLGDNYIEISQYEYKRNTFVDDKILGIKEKTVRIFVSGETVTKIETEILDKDLGKTGGEVVEITDPSPAAEGTDDIILTHKLNNKNLIDNKKLGDVKNNRAFPVRNSIKREFLVPHYTYAYDTILKIAELYYGAAKDVDDSMAEFLKNMTNY